MRSTALTAILCWIAACSTGTTNPPDPDSGWVLGDTASPSGNDVVIATDSDSIAGGDIDTSSAEAFDIQDDGPPTDALPGDASFTDEGVPDATENDASLDVGPRADAPTSEQDSSSDVDSDTGSNWAGYYPPYSQGSDCPDKPHRSNIRMYQPSFDTWGPEMPAYWAPESVWVTDDGKVRVRAAWVHAAYCWDSRADLLPSGWMTVEIDPATSSLFVVNFSADKLNFGTGGGYVPDIYTEGTSVHWFYSDSNTFPYCASATSPSLYDLTVDDAVVTVHGGCIELMDSDARVVGGVTVTPEGGTTTSIDIPLSVCLATDEDILASGCVGGDDVPPKHPDQIPEGMAYIYFEVGTDVVSIVDEIDDDNFMTGVCCGPWFKTKIDGKQVPVFGVHVKGWKLGIQRQRWRDFMLVLPVQPVGHTSHWTAQELEAKGAPDDFGFFYFDGFKPTGTTMASHDFYMTSPIYSVNASLTDYDSPWVQVTLTHFDENWIEGEFEGVVAPALYWDMLPRTQVGPSVPLKNGKFRVKNGKYTPFP